MQAPGVRDEEGASDVEAVDSAARQDVEEVALSNACVGEGGIAHLEHRERAVVGRAWMKGEGGREVQGDSE